MAKQTITQWLFMELDTHQMPDGNHNFEAEWRPVVYRFMASENEKRVFLRSIEIEVEVPDDFDPTGRQIAALEKRKADATAAYQGLVAEINARISKLQAITYEPGAPDEQSGYAVDEAGTFEG